MGMIWLAFKDELAFEVVETAARFLCGLLLEKSMQRLTGDDLDKRSALTEQYHLDSLAMVAGNKMKLQRAAAAFAKATA